MSDSDGNVSQCVAKETATCNNSEYVYLTLKVQTVLKVIATSLEANWMTSDSMLIILLLQLRRQHTTVLLNVFQSYVKTFPTVKHKYFISTRLLSVLLTEEELHSFYTSKSNGSAKTGAFKSKNCKIPLWL